MEWARAALLCVAGGILASVLRPQRPEMAMATALTTGVLAASLLLPSVRDTVETVRSLMRQAGGGEIETLIKATGIALICEFSAQLCRDAGESALAGRAELAGRAALAALAAPMLAGFVRDVSALLSLPPSP